MKKNVLLFVLFTCVMALHAQDRVAVLNPTTPTEILTADEKVNIREAIGLIVGSNDAYKPLALDIIDRIVSTVIAMNENWIIDPDTRIGVGKLLAAQKLITTEVTYSSDGFFYVYCKQIDIATGVIDKQRHGKIKYRKHLNVAAKEAASVFAKDPTTALRDVKEEKEAIEKTIADEFKAGNKKTGDKSITKWNPFRLKIPYRTFGLSAEYTQRERVLKDVATGTIVNHDYWGKKSLTGAQFGFRYDKYLAPKFFGLGIHSGLSVGYYAMKSKPSSVGANEKLAFEELALSIPLQGIYRLDFSQHIGCYITCGLSADIGLYSRIRVSGDDTNEVYTNIYDEKEWGNLPRFNYSLVYGAGVQIDRLMLGVSMSKGLSNQSEDPTYEIFQNRKMQVALILTF
jgi:hypothetical protein